MSGTDDGASFLENLGFSNLTKGEILFWAGKMDVTAEEIFSFTENEFNFRLKMAQSDDDIDVGTQKVRLYGGSDRTIRDILTEAAVEIEGLICGSRSASSSAMTTSSPSQTCPQQRPPSFLIPRRTTPQNVQQRSQNSSRQYDCDNFNTSPSLHGFNAAPPFSSTRINKSRKANANANATYSCQSPSCCANCNATYSVPSAGCSPNINATYNWPCPARSGSMNATYTQPCPGRSANMNATYTQQRCRSPSPQMNATYSRRGRSLSPQMNATYARQCSPSTFKPQNIYGDPSMSFRPNAAMASTPCPDPCTGRKPHFRNYTDYFMEFSLDGIRENAQSITFEDFTDTCGSVSASTRTFSMPKQNRCRGRSPGQTYNVQPNYMLNANTFNRPGQSVGNQTCTLPHSQPRNRTFNAQCRGPPNQTCTLPHSQPRNRTFNAQCRGPPNQTCTLPHSQPRNRSCNSQCHRPPNPTCTLPHSQLRNRTCNSQCRRSPNPTCTLPQSQTRNQTYNTQCPSVPNQTYTCPSSPSPNHTCNTPYAAAANQTYDARRSMLSNRTYNVPGNMTYDIPQTPLLYNIPNCPYNLSARRSYSASPGRDRNMSPDDFSCHSSPSRTCCDSGCDYNVNPRPYMSPDRTFGRSRRRRFSPTVTFNQSANRTYNISPSHSVTSSVGCCDNNNVNESSIVNETFSIPTSPAFTISSRSRKCPAASANSTCKVPDEDDCSCSCSSNAIPAMSEDSECTLDAPQDDCDDEPSNDTFELPSAAPKACEEPSAIHGSPSAHRLGFRIPLDITYNAKPRRTFIQKNTFCIENENDKLLMQRPAGLECIDETPVTSRHAERRSRGTVRACELRHATFGARLVASTPKKACASRRLFSNLKNTCDDKTDTPTNTNC